MLDQIRALERDIRSKQQQLANLRRERCGERVEDYPLAGPDGRTRLSELFGPHEQLIAVHNMGKCCPYCTLWADGFNGLYQHLSDRAAFAVITPDPPAVAHDFAHARHWQFPLYSENGSGFAAAMGFASEDGYEPGVSTFVRDADGAIRRISAAPFGPGDPYCGLWHLFDLLPDGAGDWQPKYRY